MSRYRYVKAFNKVDFVLPVTSVLVALSYPSLVNTNLSVGIRTEPSELVGVVLGCLLGIIAVGILLRERLAFAAYSIVAFVVFGLQITHHGVRMIFPHGSNRVQDFGIFAWVITLCGVYCLFRVLTGGVGMKVALRLRTGWNMNGHRSGSSESSN